MVFTGDWNGGERIFRIAPGQKLSLEGVRRIDPATDEARPLSAGSLELVDRYSFANPTTVRWRSRLPSDPPFQDTEIIYELTYSLSGILLKQGSTYRLDHDFAFPDRTGSIDRFSLDLDLDPVWGTPPGFARHRQTGRLPPGVSYVVTVDLTHSGGGSPAAARSGTSRAARLALFGILAASLGLMGWIFFNRESSLGRFARGPGETVDEPWLEKNLLTLEPEEAGALWDQKIGPPEVTAVLARLTAEKKIETGVSGKDMTMKLVKPISSFEGYEKELLTALFFGKTETSTSAIKAHYKSQGFDPADKIRPGLEQGARRARGFPGPLVAAEALAHGPAASSPASPFSSPRPPSDRSAGARSSASSSPTASGGRSA